MLANRSRCNATILLGAAALFAIVFFVITAPHISKLPAKLKAIHSTVSDDADDSSSSEWFSTTKISSSSRLEAPEKSSVHKSGSKSKKPNHSTQSDKAKSDSPYAYVTFLQDHYKHDNGTADDEDEYFIASRLLAYQLMHSPKTATNTSIPFVFVCTPKVRESKKKTLEADGALIVDIDYIPNPDWMNESGVSERWATVMTKMRIFQLLQYKKILLLDSDIFVIDRLDGIFQDPSTEVLPTNNALVDERDIGKLPETYMMAGQGQARGWDHMYPPDPNEQMYGAGFFLTTPSQSLFDYYMALLEPDEKGKGRFDPVFPEQNLMNYAHRRDGPMPWMEVNYRWTTTYPTIDNYNAGARSLHHKFWWDSTNTPDHGLNSLTSMWWRARGEMDGFYHARDLANN